MHLTRFKRHGDPLIVKILPSGSRPYDSILKYGTRKVNDCLLYLGELNHGGYGVTVGKKLAHRVIYEESVGPIPAGFWIDHTCHNRDAGRGECLGGPCLHRSCINIAHLRAVTPQANTLASPITGGKTHCKRGHEYTPKNTYIQKQSRGYGFGRVCRTCRREQWVQAQLSQLGC